MVPPGDNNVTVQEGLESNQRDEDKASDKLDISGGAPFLVTEADNTRVLRKIDLW
jgi:hypothetical protein